MFIAAAPSTWASPLVPAVRRDRSCGGRGSARDRIGVGSEALRAVPARRLVQSARPAMSSAAVVERWMGRAAAWASSRVRRRLDML